MSVIEVVALISCVLLALLVGYAVSVLLQLKRTLEDVSKFINATGPVLKEAESTLRSVRQVTENVNAVAEDARSLSSTLSSAASNIRHVTDSVRNIGASFESRGGSGFKSGLMAVFDVIKTIIAFRKGGNKDA